MGSWCNWLAQESYTFKVGGSSPSLPTNNYIRRSGVMSIWVHDRDRNAAINILEEGKRIIGCRTPELKPVGEASCGRPSGKPDLRSSVSLKQEERINSFS